MVANKLNLNPQTCKYICLWVRDGGPGGEEGVGKGRSVPPVWWLWQTGWCVLLYQQARDSQRVRERGKKGKTVQNKRYKLNTQQHGWDRQEEDRRETQEVGFWSWQHWAAGKASISHFNCLNLATEYNYRNHYEHESCEWQHWKNVSPLLSVTHMQFMPWGTIGGKVM